MARHRGLIVKSFLILLVLSLLSLSAQAIEYASADFRTIGQFSGISLTHVYDVSADGSVLVVNGSTGGTSQAYRWSEEQGMQPLGFLSSEYPSSGLAGKTIPLEISGDGSTIVGYSNYSFIFNGNSEVRHEAFRWTEATGIEGLGFFGLDPIPPFGSSRAKGVNYDGSVVVGDEGDGGVGDPCGPILCGFVWTPDDGMIIPDTGRDPAVAVFDVSADGSTMALISGTYDTGNYGLWSEENGFVEIPRPIPGTNFSWGKDIKLSADGKTVALQSNLDSMAHVWSELEGLRALDEARPRYSLEPFDLSADGSVVVGWSTELFGMDPFISSISGAFIWDADAGTRFLKDVLIEAGVDLTGWGIGNAYGISDDGLTIVGNATNPDGERVIFIAELTPVPVPAAYWLFGSALGLLGWMSRKKAK